MTGTDLGYRTLTGTLELRADGIYHKGRLYPYSSVVHLGRYASTTFFNFIPMQNYLRIKIYIEHVDKPITVHNWWMFTGRLKKMYERLVQETFEIRANRYLNQLKTSGFYEYSGARFVPPNEVQIKNEKFDLRAMKISLAPFEFEVKQRRFFSRARRISTEIDQDVFFTLLKELFRISFRK